MAYTLLADVIIPSKFLPYMIQRTATLSALWQSGIVQTNEQFNALCRGAGKTFDMPFWTEYDDADQVMATNTAITVGKLSSSRDVSRKQMRATAVGAEDLVPLLIEGDPMAAVATMFARYWARRFQAILLSTLKGVFGAANMSASILNIFTEDGANAVDANKLNGLTFIDALALLGDASGKLGAIAIHSATMAALKKKDLIDFLPDSEGKATIATFQGRQIIEDDGLPARVGTPSGTVYTSYIFGQGAIAEGDNDLSSRPVEGGHGSFGLELNRVALMSESAVITRREFILHPRGVKWLEGSVAGDFPTNTELENSANWTRVYEQKNVRIVQVNHNN